jgi:hypothetical protein
MLEYLFLPISFVKPDGNVAFCATAKQPHNKIKTIKLKRIINFIKA